MFGRNNTQADLASVIEMLREQNVASRNATASGNSLYSFKNLNALAIAAVIGLGAFVWTGVTEQPKKSQEQYTLLQTQNAEIRTTALETKTAVVALGVKFDAIQKEQGDARSQIDKNSGAIDALNQRVSQNSARLDQLEKETR